MFKHLRIFNTFNPCCFILHACHLLSLDRWWRSVSATPLIIHCADVRGVFWGSKDLDVGRIKRGTTKCKDFNMAVFRLNCFHFTSHIMATSTSGLVKADYSQSIYHSRNFPKAFPVINSSVLHRRIPNPLHVLDQPSLSHEPIVRIYASDIQLKPGDKQTKHSVHLF